MKPLPKRKTKRNPAELTREADHEAPNDRLVMGVRRRRLMVGLAIGTALVASFVGLTRFGADRAEALPAARVTTSSVAHADFAEFVPVTAQVVPAETVYLDSVEGGRVVSLEVEDGALVEAGQPIVTLKNTDLELEVVGREAQYAEQLSNLARAQIDFEQGALRHSRDLADAELQIELAEAALKRRLPREETGVAQSEIDRLRSELAHHKRSRDLVATARRRDGRNAAANLKQLRGAVKRMEESLALLRGSLGDLTVTAPIAGQVTALSVKVGEVVARGARVGQVDNIRAFKLRARVDEHYLARLVTGQLARVTIEGKARELEVVKIYPQVQDRHFEVDLAFNVDDRQAATGLRQGQSLRVRIELGATQKALTIAAGPFYEQTGGLWLFVVSADGKHATRRDVRLGRRNDQHIEVLSGLAAGESVLTSSYAGLIDKTELRLTGAR